MENLINELERIPQTEWAKIWASLNKYKIPEELKHIKPDWWDVGFDIERRSEFVSPLMWHIVHAVGMKACNREWNRESMTDAEHEEFWKHNKF